MKKLLLYLTLTLFAFACGENDEPQPTPPEPKPKPRLEIESIGIEATSARFELTTDIATAYCYTCVETTDDMQSPSAGELFAQNVSKFDSTSAEISLDGLAPETRYTLFAAASADGEMSDVKQFDFTTSAVDPLIELLEESVTYDSFSLRIRAEEGRSFLFSHIDKLLLDMSGYTDEQYLEMFGMSGYGDTTVDFKDGETYFDALDVPYEIGVKPGREYIVFAAYCDKDKKLTDVLHRVEFTTPEKPRSEHGITVEVSDITSIAARIATTPDDNIAEYYVYVRDKAWYDSVIDYGESMMISLVKRAYETQIGARLYTAAADETYDDLTPATEYTIGLVVIDNEGNESFISDNIFTTAAPTGITPEVGIVMQPSGEAPHTILDLNIKTGLTKSIKYAFAPTADVREELDNNGGSYESLIDMRGVALSAEQVAQANSDGGLTLKMDELWYDTEYTCVVCAVSAEQLSVVDHTAARTSAEPKPARVESELFALLPGKWSLSYDYVDLYKDPQRIEGAEITIADTDGAGSRYRDYNRLLVEGYQFQTNYATDPMPYYSAEYLIDYASYWRDFQSLAYRDFGPKFFLEVAADGSVTVPTSKHVYLYGWSDSPILFFGADLDKMYTAPVSFPVEISDDGNTITIKACHAGPEFSNGIYRPAVFLGQTMRNAATSDIVLRRLGEQTGSSTHRSSALRPSPRTMPAAQTDAGTTARFTHIDRR